MPMTTKRCVFCPRAIGKNKRDPFCDHCYKHHLKQCTNCKKWKLVKYFYRDRSNTDGLMSYCKECKSLGAKRSWKRWSQFDPICPNLSLPDCDLGVRFAPFCPLPSIKIV